jgi:hypothetical protein
MVKVVTEPANLTPKLGYQVAVPSYDRAAVLIKKTLPCLNKLQRGDLSNVTVFVANKTELDVYTKLLDANGYEDLTVAKGVKGILNQRRWMHNHFYPKGTKLVSFDDDIERLETTVDGKHLLPYAGTLSSLVKRGFALCDKHKTVLWGIYPVCNAYFMKNKHVVGLRYIIACVHGCYAGDPAICGPTPKRVGGSATEDIETTLRVYQKHGCVVRMEDVTMRTKYFAEGGIASELGGDRDAEHRRSIEAVGKAYPDLTTIYEKKNYPMIRFKTITRERVARPVQTQDAE